MATVATKEVGLATIGEGSDSDIWKKFMVMTMESAAAVHEGLATKDCGRDGDGGGKGGRIARCPSIDRNNSDYYPSHSLSMLRPSACLIDPSAAGLAPGVRPASSASSASDASSSVFSSYPSNSPFEVGDSRLCHVTRRLDKVQKEVRESKEERGMVLLMGSPFTQEIQDKPRPASFRLPTLEA
ncbi:hypothetical protein BHE74_00034066 [Ensete ventricosum]|nr:hypothetical protein BHE74_00034066 [Ensete ventricosum]